MDLQQKLTRAFFISFALLMGLGAHYFQHNQGGSGLELAVNNVVWIFFSILIGLGLWKITAQQKIYYSKYTAIIFVALSLFLLPIFYPNNLLADQSYTRLLGLFAGILLFISLQQFNFTRTQIEKLLLLIVLAGFIQACYSLTQDYLLSAGNYFGYNVGYGRPYGIFQQANVLASFMATTFILSGYLFHKVADRRIQVFLLLTTVLNIWVITITMSRSGYLGSIISLLLLLPWALQTNKKRFILFVLAILIGLGIASLKTFEVKGKGEIQGESVLGARNLMVAKEAGIRVDFYRNSWAMIKQKPLLGYGYGGFEKAYLINYAEGVKKGELKQFSQIITHPHNDLLFWAIEGGIVPILAIFLLIITFLLLLRSFNLTKSLALLALVVPISLHTQTEYPLYHSALHWFVLMTLIFYIDYESGTVKEKTFTPSFFLKVAGLLIPLFTTIFMLTNLHAMAKVTEYERSKERDIRTLIDIVNPLVFDNNFSLHLYEFRLNIAIQTGNKAEIGKVVTELEKTIIRLPKPYFYRLLYAAYQYNGQPQKANDLLDYALYLFAGNKYLINLDKVRKEASKAVSAVQETKNIDQTSASLVSSTGISQ